MTMATVPQQRHAKLLAALTDILNQTDLDKVDQYSAKTAIERARSIALQAIREDDFETTIEYWLALHEDAAQDWPSGCAECVPMRAVLIKHQYSEKD